MLDPHIRADEDQQSFYPRYNRRKAKGDVGHSQITVAASVSFLPSKLIIIIIYYKGYQSSFLFFFFFFFFLHLDFVSQPFYQPIFHQPTTGMATMNALAVEVVGKPIALIRRPIPTPTDGEILIKVTVVGCMHSSYPRLPHGIE